MEKSPKIYKHRVTLFLTLEIEHVRLIWLIVGRVEMKFTLTDIAAQ